jgi:hypothetical protein
MNSSLFQIIDLLDALSVVLCGIGREQSSLT